MKHFKRYKKIDGDKYPLENFSTRHLLKCAIDSADMTKKELIGDCETKAEKRRVLMQTIMED